MLAVKDPRNASGVSRPKAECLGFDHNLKRSMQGNMPGRDELEQLQSEVCSTEDLRKPINLAQKLLSTPGINKEVGSAMTELLQVCFTPQMCTDRKASAQSMCLIPRGQT